MSLARAIPVAAIVALAGCASSPQLYVHRSPRFTQYRTFTVATDDAPPRYRRHPLRAEVAGLVQNDLSAVLTERGYQLASAGAGGDLVVRVGVGEHLKQEVPAQQTDSTGSSTEATPQEERDMDAPFQYSEATLVIDMFDAKTTQRVWHGVARELISTSNVDQAAVDRAIRGLLQQFPIAATAVAR